MIIFVDGFQNSGKTTLIENCQYYFHDRFPFNQYLDKFNLDMNTYQITKDLAMLFCLKFVKDNIIFDRGPLSTAYYSIKEHRYGLRTERVISQFLQEVGNYPNCRFIFVKKINDNNSIKRNHQDGFDYINDDGDTNKEELLSYMINLARLNKIEPIIFENDFSKSIEENQKRFNNLLEELTSEHYRSYYKIYN